MSYLGKKIMLIDDHDISLFVTQHMLNTLYPDIEVSLQPSGFSALHYLEQHAESAWLLPDALILDVYMPIVSANDFLIAYEKIALKLSKFPRIYLYSGFNVYLEYESWIKKGKIRRIFQKPNTKEIIQYIVKDMATPA